MSEKHPQFLTVPSSSSSVVGSASTQASPSLHIRLGAGFPPRAVQRTCGWEFIQGKSINTQHTIINITKQRNMKLMLKNQPLPPPPPAPEVCLGPTGIRPLTGRLTWEDLITVIFILVFVVVVVLLLLLSMFVVVVVVAHSLSGSSYRLSQTLSLFLSECLIMTHRLWQDIWITLEAARLQMEADPVRQSLSNIYQWSVEAIFHCSHLLFNSVPEVSSFMSSSKLLNVSSEYFTMMHCFKMIVSNCGKVFSIFLISIDFLVKLMFHVNRLFFSSLLIFPNSCIFYISIFDWVAGQPNFINENSQKPNCKK